MHGDATNPPTLFNYQHGVAEFCRLYRTTPHWGLILDEMPAFLHHGGGWGMNDSVGFLMVAAKYLEVENRNLKRQVADLEDRVALMEQVLVDAGLIR